MYRSTMLNGPTDIALTFINYLDKEQREAFRSDQLKLETVRFVEGSGAGLGHARELDLDEL
jgi:hypothetical protein